MIDVAEIGSDNPSCFFLLIEQAGSMEDEISIVSSWLKRIYLPNVNDQYVR